MKTQEEAFREQAALLAKELVDRTPPFSGKAVKRMLEARGTSLSWRNMEIEDMSAKAVGERRVEKDIRKVVYGVKGAKMPQARQRPNVIVAGTHAAQAGYDPNNVEWGVLQKCEGKPAVRIFASKRGEVYGVDAEQFIPNAGQDIIASTHNLHRTKRGRVTTAGSRDRVVGRWRWLNILVTNATNVNRYVTFRLRMVGQAKGGWAKSFIALGGRMSAKGWVGRHSDAGECHAQFAKGDIRITMINHSAWASGGDPDRIIEKSLEGRTKALSARIRRELEQRWGEGAGDGVI
ncbi:MAG: hypothetical protein ACTHLW_02190 [Verrucomicrobiota bacterium]